jgi:hypothetical protein
VFCIAVLVVASFHSAYGQNSPDHKDALNQIKNDSGSPWISSITKLEYVNGYQIDDNHYVVATTFTRVFKVSSKELYDKDGVYRGKAVDKAIDENPLAATMAVLQNLLVNYGRFEPADSLDEACNYLFLRTEKAWILQGSQGVESIITRHTERADAMDAQLEQAQAAEKAKQDEAAAAKMKADVAAYSAATDRHTAEIADACSSGRQMIIAGQGISQPLVDNNRGTIVGYIATGQVVVGVPDPNARKLLCHIRYTVGNRSMSGYVFVSSLIAR